MESDTKLLTIKWKKEVFVAKTKKELMKASNLNLPTVNELLKDSSKKLFAIQGERTITVNPRAKNFLPLLYRNFGLPKDTPISLRKMGNIKFKSNLSGRDKIDAIINVKLFTEDPSPHNAGAPKHKGKFYILRTRSFPFTGNVKQLQERIDELKSEYTFGELYDEDITITSEYDGKKSKLIDGKIYEEDPIKLFNQGLEYYKPPEGENCVLSYLSEQYPQLDTQNVRNTMGGILEFAKDNDILYKAYDVAGTCIVKNIPQKPHKKPLLICVANQHIYPITNKKLFKATPSLPFKFVNNVHQACKNYLASNQVPTRISFNHDTNEITAFSTNDSIYAPNEYKIHQKIANVFGITDTMNNLATTTLIQKIASIYEEKYHTASIWPGSNNFVKSPFNYFNSALLPKAKDTKDKNKSYSYELMELEYLIKVDFTANDIMLDLSKQDPTHFCDWHLFIVEPLQSSIILPNKNIYSGKILNFAMEKGVGFKVLEGIRTSRLENCYKEMVHKLYHSDFDDETISVVKDMINRLIGMWQRGERVESFAKFDRIATHEELSETGADGYPYILDDKYSAIFKGSEYVTVSTRKPIAFQVLDNARIRLYQLLEDNKVKSSDVVQIRTDAITLTRNLDINVDKNDIAGWKKQEEFIPFETDIIYWNTDITFKPTVKDTEAPFHSITGDAGNGKSHEIKRLIKERTDDNYIIVAPTNASLKDYKKLGMKCTAIQKFQFVHTLPEEDTIYVDEIGMIDKYALIFLYKCKIANKKVYGYGDFTQLLPVNHLYQLNHCELYKLIFNVHKTKNENWRNDFTHEDYNKMRSLSRGDAIRLVKKRSKPIDEAELVICYTNPTRRKYNKIMMDKLGIEFGDVGCKIACKTNNFKSDIHNNFTFVIKEVDGDDITLDDDTIITRKQLKKHFIPAYAVTLYTIQGDAVKSFHYPEEDWCCIDARKAYTLISRLKTK